MCLSGSQGPSLGSGTPGPPPLNFLVPTSSLWFVRLPPPWGSSLLPRDGGLSGEEGGERLCVFKGCGRSPSSWLPPAGKAWGGGCAIPAERPFLLSEQGRRKAGGDLASSQKGFGERSGTGGNPFPLLPLPQPSA